MVSTLFYSFLMLVIISTLNNAHIELLQESPQAARVKVMASGNAVERRFRLDYYITCYSMHSKL